MCVWLPSCTILCIFICYFIDWKSYYASNVSFGSRIFILIALSQICCLKVACLCSCGYKVYKYSTKQHSKQHTRAHTHERKKKERKINKINSIVLAKRTFPLGFINNSELFKGTYRSVISEVSIKFNESNFQCGRLKSSPIFFAIKSQIGGEIAQIFQ